MPPTGFELAGLDEVRGPGISDPFVTLDPAVSGTAYAGAGGAFSTKVIREPGVYLVWGAAAATVQPATRAVFLTVRRGSFGRDLEYGHLRDAAPRWRSEQYLLALFAGDEVEVSAGGGAVGDAGVVLVRWRRVGK